VSLLVSLTATPMMCSRLLTHKRHEEHNRLYHASEKAFSWVLGVYEASLAWVLEHAALTLAALLITIAVNVYLLVIVPKGFFPLQDNGIISGGIRAQQDISYQAMDRITKQVVDEIQTDPAVANVMAFTGGGSTNTANVYIGLKPLNQRKLSSSQLIDRLRPKFASLVGAKVVLQAGQDLRIGGRQGNAQ